MRRRLFLILSLTFLTAPRVRAGTLHVSTSPYDFGPRSIAGSAATGTVTISNSGSSTIVYGVTPGPNSAEFTAGSSVFPAFLGPGGTVLVNVTYDPTDRGADACTFTIADNNSVTDTFELTGTGTASELSVASTSLEFGDQLLWDAQTLDLTIENIGNESITWSTLHAALQSGAEFSVGSLSAPIAPGESGELSVTFKPLSLGAKSDVLTLSLSNDLPGDANASVTLSGTAIETAGVGRGPAAEPLVVGPSPTRGALRIAYALPRTVRASLEVCDIAGRIVARRALEPGGAEGTVTLSRGADWTPNAGVYLVRLVADGLTVGRRRVVVLP